MAVVLEEKTGLVNVIGHEDLYITHLLYHDHVCTYQSPMASRGETGDLRNQMSSCY